MRLDGASLDARPGGRAQRVSLFGLRLLWGVDRPNPSDSVLLVLGDSNLETGSRQPEPLRPCLPPVLHEPLTELWAVRGPVRAVRVRGVEARRAGDVLVGVARAAADDPEVAAREIYRRLLALVDDEGLRLARAWNLVPDIHGGPADDDRYMRFCLGRSVAFEEHFGAGFERCLPAGTAVGAGGQIEVTFLAVREPVHHLENPRQVRAYRYPPRYGARGPSFTRATCVTPASGGQLWISGTASILGHASQHLGDPRAQTIETLRNLRALVHGASGLERPLAGHVVSARVYVKRPVDLAAIRSVVEPDLAGARVTYLCADMCRRELLVEIEAVGVAAERGQP